MSVERKDRIHKALDDIDSGKPVRTASAEYAIPAPTLYYHKRKGKGGELVPAMEDDIVPIEKEKLNVPVERIDAALQYLDETGKPVSDVAKEFDVPYSRLYYEWRKRNKAQGIESVQKSARQVKIIPRELLEQALEAIRRGTPLVEVSKTFDIEYHRLYYIVRKIQRAIAEGKGNAFVEVLGEEQLPLVLPKRKVAKRTKASPEESGRLDTALTDVVSGRMTAIQASKAHDVDYHRLYYKMRKYKGEDDVPQVMTEHDDTVDVLITGPGISNEKPPL